MSKKKAADKKAMQRDIARRYHDFTDTKTELGSGISAYRTLACKDPEALDAATLAAVLSGSIKFDRSAGTVLFAYIEGDEDAEAPAFASFRKGISAMGDDGSKVVKACEEKGHTDVLVEALVYVFIEEHEDDFNIDTGVDGFPEPENDDDEDLPGKAPEGYPSDDSDDADKADDEDKEGC